MGNFLSCYVDPTTRNVNETTRTSILMDLSGNMRQVIKEPIVAAEIMLDAQGMLLSPANRLLETKRLIPMTAEEDLFPGNVYVLFHSSRANSKASEKELEFLVSYADVAHDRDGKRRRRGAVSPDVVVQEGKGGGGDHEVMTGFRGSRKCVTGSYSKYWMPVLETITEEV